MPIVALTSVVVFTPWGIVKAWLAPMPGSVQEQVDDAVDHGLDGIIVYVDQAGSAPAFYAAGWKNRENRVPADPHALFKIASISKLYIAAATARLVNARLLKLDDTLSDHLPALDGRIENADRITVRMMLQHRSGIPNLTDDPDFSWFEPPAKISDYLEPVLDDPADFEPGARFSYSNTNYLLIGEILDKILGFNHQRYIDREMVAPLGLAETYGSLGEADFEQMASGYHHPYDADLRELDYKSPGGSMVATAQDVGIFLRALNDGSLLNDDEQAVYSSVYQYEHTGWVPGYYSIARYHRDIDSVVIQFVSTTGGDTVTISKIVYDRIVRILSRQE
jgi:CubicO group peptidase (beta-lactamase class C family)